MQTDIFIFDVGMGQSIFVYPHSNPEYGMMIDCGHQDNFHPIEWLTKNNWIHNNNLSNLTLTNYDHDHFSGIVNLRDKVNIKTVSFAKNLTSQEIAAEKTDHTEHLDHIYDIKARYTSSAVDYNPPYIKTIFSLEKSDLDVYDTNNLSQVVFIEHHGTTICVSGDLEKKGWDAIINKYPQIKNFLGKTNVFIASHHGRDNGYYPDIFTHCSPECIIISDKGIVHDTQKDMATVYGGHVSSGVSFNNDSSVKRKVLTTRSDGHLWLRLAPNGIREYRNMTIS